MIARVRVLASKCSSTAAARSSALAQAASSWRSRARACRPKASSTSGGWCRYSARSTAWSRSASASMPRWRPARRSSARSWVRVSFAAARGGGGGGEDGAGLGAQQAVALVGEGGEDGRVVLAQQRAQLVVRAGAVPDRVLLGAGEHGDRLGQFGVGGQRPVRGQVGAQDVGQHQRVAGVGLLAAPPSAGPGSGTTAIGLIANTVASGGAQARPPAGRGWSRSPPGSAPRRCRRPRRAAAAARRTRPRRR